VVGGIMLGLGRRSARPWPVTFVIGNAEPLPTRSSIPRPPSPRRRDGVPGEPAGSLKQSALFALGFLLFVISFIVLATSRWLLRSRLKA
jgi:phosphate transport system permease protein